MRRIEDRFSSSSSILLDPLGASTPDPPPWPWTLDLGSSIILLPLILEYPPPLRSSSILNHPFLSSSSPFSSSTVDPRGMKEDKYAEEKEEGEYSDQREEGGGKEGRGNMMTMTMLMTMMMLMMQEKRGSNRIATPLLIRKTLGIVTPRPNPDISLV